MRIGDYEVLAEIARGGFGAVYRARHPSGREVAIKVLLELSGPDELERFLREGQATSRLNHPNVVRVHEASRDQGRPYLVMDLVEGASLAKRIASEGPLPEAEAVRIVGEVAAAVQAAHSLGILHRDLKPENVLLHEGRPLLADFGLARIAAAKTLTQTGELMGTPGYMAPEQILGDKTRIGPPTDVYGLGATLYACLGGAPPFRGPTPLATIDMALREAPRPLHELRPDVDRRLETICLRCLARDESERYASAADLLDALEAWGVPQEQPRRQLPWAPLGVLALALTAAAVASLGWLTTRPGSGAPSPSTTPSTTPSTAPTPTPPTAAAVAEARALLGEGKDLLDRDLPQAATLLHEALQLDPGLAPAQIELAIASVRRFRLDEAERLLGGLSPSALERAERARLHFARGRIHFEREKRALAHEEFAKAASLDRHAAYPAWRGLTSSPMDSEAVRVSRALNADEPAAALLLIALALQVPKPSAEDYALTLNFAAQVLEKSPEYPALAALTAKLRYASGDESTAQAAVEALNGRWPRHPTILHVLGWIYSHKGSDAEAPGPRRKFWKQADAHLLAALEISPWNQFLRRDRAWLLRAHKRYAEAFAAYQSLASDHPEFRNSLNAFYTFTNWIRYACNTRDLRGFEDLKAVTKQARDLLLAMKAEPELLDKTPFAKPPDGLAGTERWFWLQTARLCAIQGLWTEFDGIVNNLWTDRASRAQVLEVRLISLAERLQSEARPDPAVLAQHIQDLQRANEFQTSPAAVEAIWLGASQDPQIRVEVREVEGRDFKKRHLTAKRALSRAIHDQGHLSPRALEAWKDLVRLEPHNLLARVFCARVASHHPEQRDYAVEVCEAAPEPLLRDPVLVTCWARAVIKRGRQEDFAEVRERLSSLLSQRESDLARAARVEISLLLNRPLDAKRDLQLLRGKVSPSWFADYEGRVKAFLEFGR